MSADRAVGIIGLDRLGLVVAKRLASGGFDVVAFDADPARIEALAGSGAEPTTEAAEVWSARELVLLALQDDATTGAELDAAIGTIRRGTVVADLHMGDPRAAARSAGRLESAGAGYVDAPLVGSIAQIERGDAVAMIGGHPEAVARCDELWPVLARERFVIGGAGSGQSAMLAINLVLGLNRAALAEGLAFAEALGLDGSTFIELLRATPAYSRAVDSKGVRMVTRNYEPDLQVRMQRHDLDLVLDAATRAGGDLPFSRALAGLLDDTIAAGDGDLDSAVIVEALRRRFPA